ncbi:hypothetical protein HDU96_007255 [Phlyctochytrium bullatum]|nr:hypothetical protein HDU96_007255 [Phlyctochytrium bullatum]
MKDRRPYHAHFECDYLEESYRIPSGSKFTKWFSNVLDACCEPGRKHVLEMYNREDLLDLCRWVVAFGARALAEQDLRDLSVKVDEDVPFPSLDHVKELVDNADVHPEIEREQLQYLYVLMSTISKLLGTTTNAMRKKKAADTKMHHDAAACLKEKPSCLSQLFVWTFPSFEEFKRNINIRQFNSFGLWDEGLENLGQGIYPTASFFNHSCGPNTLMSMNTFCLDTADGDGQASENDGELLKSLSITDDPSELSLFSIAWAILKEPVVTFKAAVTIEEGEELTHAYIDINRSVTSRRELLLKAYSFIHKLEEVAQSVSTRQGCGEKTSTSSLAFDA